MSKPTRVLTRQSQHPPSRSARSWKGADVSWVGPTPWTPQLGSVLPVAQVGLLRDGTTLGVEASRLDGVATEDVAAAARLLLEQGRCSSQLQTGEGGQLDDLRRPLRAVLLQHLDRAHRGLPESGRHPGPPPRRRRDGLLLSIRRDGSACPGNDHLRTRSAARSRSTDRRRAQPRRLSRRRQRCRPGREAGRARPSCPSCRGTRPRCRRDGPTVAGGTRRPWRRGRHTSSRSRRRVRPSPLRPPASRARFIAVTSSSGKGGPGMARLTASSGWLGCTTEHQR